QVGAVRHTIEEARKYRGRSTWLDLVYFLHHRRLNSMPLQQMEPIRPDPMKYVLITPAHNEEAFIPKTLASMVDQTVPPERWDIVDDGSMDRTPEIVEEYATRFPWIELVRYHERQD